MACAVCHHCTFLVARIHARSHAGARSLACARVELGNRSRARRQFAHPGAFTSSLGCVCARFRLIVFLLSLSRSLACDRNTPTRRTTAAPTCAASRVARRRATQRLCRSQPNAARAALSAARTSLALANGCQVFGDSIHFFRLNPILCFPTHCHSMRAHFLALNSVRVEH